MHVDEGTRRACQAASCVVMRSLFPELRVMLALIRMIEFALSRMARVMQPALMQMMQGMMLVMQLASI